LLCCINLVSCEQSKTTEDSYIDGIWSKDGVKLSTPSGDVPVADLLLNSFTFSDYSINQRIRIIAHEMGHVLELHEFNTPLQQLGSADIVVYEYLWKDDD
jgi:hypothetical protein